MVEAPERIWANPDAGYCTTIGNSTYTVEYIRADLAILSDVVAECEAEPVDDRSFIYDSEAAPNMRTSPPTSELEALRKRVAELEDEAVGYLEELIDHNGDSLDDRRTRRVEELHNGRRVREGGKVE